jgi:hypothetical protein
MAEELDWIWDKDGAPPLGLAPRWVADERRLRDIEAALGRYRGAGLEPRPEWLEERGEIVARLRACGRWADETTVGEIRSPEALAAMGGQFYQLDGVKWCDTATASWRLAPGIGYVKS